jgi:hypothetical protein
MNTCRKWLQIITTVSLNYTPYRWLYLHHTQDLLSLHYPLLGSGFQQLTFFLWFPELYPISATSFSFLSTATLNWLNQPLKVKVSLQLAVYRQSVCHGAKPLDVHDQSFFFKWTLAIISLYDILSDKKMSLPLMNMLGPCQLYVSHIYIACYWKLFPLHYIQVLCFGKQIMSVTYVMLQRQFSHLNGLKLNRRQV